MQPIRTLESRTVVLPFTNIDTDQIIPARFLTTTTRDGLGKQAFADWRYDANGATNADFVLNQPGVAGCSILVAGRNFGCGSSREHAPWALLDFGFRAVISTEIADIFRNNSLKNGLLPIVVDEHTHGWLMNNPGAQVKIDVETTTISLPGGATATFPIEGFARYCLMNGVDELGFLLKQAPAIERYEAAHPALR
jgi:3-isopropylmalate/(R)-2-methylmalate dehydratase small subunit